MPEARPHIRVEIVEQLPGGVAVLPLESRGEVVYRFAAGHISEQARAELEAAAQHLINTSWAQNWGGTIPSPPHLRSAS